ncbi:MAG: hypothetical protein NVS9B12_03640 [Vulcanimicrobiaceae bacterium]
MALAALALLTFAACTGGGSSPLPATSTASTPALRLPKDGGFGGTGEAIINVLNPIVRSTPPPVNGSWGIGGGDW